MNAKKTYLYGLSLLMLSVFCGCSATSRGMKHADEAIARGDYYTAAIEYLNVLRIDRKHSEALTNLANIAKPAYEQKLTMAEGYQAQGNFEASLVEYKDLETYLSRLKIHNLLNFVPIDIDQAIHKVSMAAAEKHYLQAEIFFAQRDFTKAISEYRVALDFVGIYKDCTEKIAESYFRLAVDFEKNRNYRSAAKTYENAHAVIRDYKNSLTKAAGLYYALGSYFFSIGQYRKAYEDLGQAQALNPQYRDVNQKWAMARDKAIVKIAFVNFDNPTGRDVAGMVLGDYIFSAIKSDVQAKASAFVQLLDREDLLVLARMQKINESLLNDEWRVPAKLTGVHYLIFGRFTQVRNIRAGLTETQLSDYYQYSYDVAYIDSKGQKAKRKEWANAPLYYSIFKDKLAIALAGTVKVLEVKSGRAVIEYPFSEKTGDEIVYAGKFLAAHDLNADNIRIADEIKKLSGARRELKDEEFFAKEMIKAIANPVAQQILTNLDTAPTLMDPTLLEY
jgi:tetratricopeptide (TPR) repeat protein